MVVIVFFTAALPEVSTISVPHFYIPFLSPVSLFLPFILTLFFLSPSFLLFIFVSNSFFLNMFLLFTIYVVLTLFPFSPLKPHLLFSMFFDNSSKSLLAFFRCVLKWAWPIDVQPQSLKWNKNSGNHRGTTDEKEHISKGLTKGKSVCGVCVCLWTHLSFVFLCHDPVGCTTAAGLLNIPRGKLWIDSTVTISAAAGHSVNFFSFSSLVYQRCWIWAQLLA